MNSDSNNNNNNGQRSHLTSKLLTSVDAPSHMHAFARRRVFIVLVHTILFGFMPTYDIKTPTTQQHDSLEVYADLSYQSTGEATTRDFLGGLCPPITSKHRQCNSTILLGGYAHKSYQSAGEATARDSLGGLCPPMTSTHRRSETHMFSSGLCPAIIQTH